MAKYKYLSDIQYTNLADKARIQRLFETLFLLGVNSYRIEWLYDRPYRSSLPLGWSYVD